jgi:hypothetical protein
MGSRGGLSTPGDAPDMHPDDVRRLESAVRPTASSARLRPRHRPQPPSMASTRSFGDAASRPASVRSAGSNDSNATQPMGSAASRPTPHYSEIQIPRHHLAAKFCSNGPDCERYMPSLHEPSLVPLRSPVAHGPSVAQDSSGARDHSNSPTGYSGRHHTFDHTETNFPAVNQAPTDFPSAPRASAQPSMNTDLTATPDMPHVDDAKVAGQRNQKKRGSTSLANEKELRRLLNQNIGRTLDEVAAQVRTESNGPRSEKSKQIYGMLW